MRGGAARGGSLVIALVIALLPACVSSDPRPPRRVLLVGDSIMNQVAERIRRMPRADRDVRNEAVNGSGLLSPADFDWVAHLERVLGAYDPDVVAFLFIGNYPRGPAGGYAPDDGPVIRHKGSRRFFAAWQSQAEAMTRMAAEDAEVLWVLPPPMRAPADQRVVDGLREAYSDIADEVEGTRTVDAYDVLATEGGGFDPLAPGPGEGQARLRRTDGVHLAPLGARRLAILVDEAIAQSS